MKSPTILVTVLTVAALGATPAVASAGIALNHNEILVASSAV